MSYFPAERRRSVVLSAGQGQAVDGPTGQPMFIKAGKDDTLGAHAAIEYSHAPGAAGPPAHIHHEHEEAFLVIEGELTVGIDDEVITLGPGGCALVPRGAVISHATTALLQPGAPFSPRRRWKISSSR